MQESSCGSSTLFADAGDNRLVAIPMRCRRWSCPTCGPRERKKVIARFAAGDPTTLLTLTTNPHQYPTTVAAFKDVTRKVNHLFKRLRRRFPKGSLEYALVWETTRKGWPHAHILLRAPFLPQAMVSHLWKVLSGASVVDIRRVSGARHAATYVAKYLAKNPQVPPGSKRFRTSRNYSPAQTSIRLRDFLDCGPFHLTRYGLDDLERSWRAEAATTHRWMPWLTVGYFPSTQTPP